MYSVNHFVVCVGLLLVLEVPILSAQFTGVRIIGGDKPNTGLVEIHGPEGWGTICSDDGNWDLRSARVVCRYMGYEDVVLAQEAHAGLYGHSMGPTYVTNVICNGDEDNLLDCQYDVYAGRGCSYEAAVFCEIPGYFGCYHQSALLSNERTTYDFMTVDFCIEYCHHKHYMYAGLQYDTCHCSNGGGGIANALSTSCNFPCPGHIHHICGGLRFYSVYETNKGYCHDPGSPTNGFSTSQTYRDDNVYHFGAYITFSCRDNFWLIGAREIQCVIGDSPDEVKWSDAIPKCSDVPPPPATDIPIPRRPSETDSTPVTTSTDGYISIAGSPSSGRNRRKLGWLTLLFLAIIIAIVIFVIIFVRRKRSKRDINDNPRSSMGHGANELSSVGQSNTAVTITSNTSSYAEIEDGSQVPPVMATNGITQHDQEKIATSSNGAAPITHNGVTQHELTYNGDQVIASTAAGKEGSTSTTSYDEIDDSERVTSDNPYASLDKSTREAQNPYAGLRMGDSNQESNPQPQSDMGSMPSYAEIDDAQVTSDKKGRIQRPTKSGNKQSPPLSMISSASYAEIEETQSRQGKSAVSSSASYAEIEETQSRQGKSAVSSSASYAEIEETQSRQGKSAVSSSASYAEIEETQSRQGKSAVSSSASYAEIEETQSRQGKSAVSSSASYAEIEETQSRQGKSAVSSSASYAEIEETQSRQGKSAVSSSASYAEIEETQSRQGKSAVSSSASYAEIEDPRTNIPANLPKDSVASYITFQAGDQPGKNSVASYMSFQTEGQLSPGSDGSGESNVFYENTNADRPKSIKRPASNQLNKRPVSELPPITEVEEMLQRSKDSQRRSSVGTVENIIYEGPDS